jgi:hypothetical protein
MIDIIIPTIRPWAKLEMTLTSLAANSVIPHLVHITRDGNSYAQAVNLAYARTKQPFVFMGADDLRFFPGWDTACMRVFNQSEKIMVCGTNDLHQPPTKRGEGATHYMARRSYLEKFTGTVDRSFPVLFEYKHNYTDTEFVAVAQARRVYGHAVDSHVEHVHPAFFPAIIPDEGYLKSKNTCSEDAITFLERRKQWTLLEPEIRG